MKIKHYIFIAIALLLGSCTEEDVDRISPSQRALIGQGINLNASIADPYVTRTTYRHDGSFNEGDIMTIYRQYSHDAGITFDATTEAYRVYELKTKYATGTTFALETDWLPKKDELGSNTPGETFTQTEADSLTWENGKTVRFRSWSRSDLADAISKSSSDKNRYYPDYCISEWVTVSGPTIDVPMTLKHQGCRIGFVAKAGNELQKAEICTDWHDYMWKDNADTYSADESDSEHGKSEAEARAEAEAVKAVYEQMCMPAGVDVEESVLKTMTKTLYDATTDFLDIHAKTANDGIVELGAKTPTQIASDVQRPVFCSNDGRLYMVTIPYDMSNGTQKGEGLKLPACTRFKVWLYDVNDGDGTNTGGGNYEATYHILTLGDLQDRNNNLIYENGLELVPGNSYMFSVGYYYDKFTVTPADNFSWVRQDAEVGTVTNEVQQPALNSEPYGWWKDAIKNAIPADLSQPYQPVFHIQDETQFLEFIKLVNGTAATQTSGLKRVLQEIDDPDHEGQKKTICLWYRSNAFDQFGKLLPEAVPVDKATAEAEGYIFYEHYYPANADQGAYSLEDYLQGPFSFYDDNLRRHFTIYLDNDLDLCDWKLDPIGNEETIVELNNDDSKPFRGVFDGQMHTLKNVYFDGGYMFKHCYGTAIRNLKIETVHDFNLVHTAEAATDGGYGAYIVGISIKAPSSAHPFATKLKGSSYVVGCIYQGRANGSMVGTADNLYMFANMMAAEGLSSSTGAFLGSYDGTSKFFAPQKGKKVTWGNFMVNYYDTELSPDVTAVGGYKDVYLLPKNAPSTTVYYLPQQYIRGAHSYILKAKNDNLLSDEVPYEKLTTALMREGYYGLAPWKAMNYALYIYNSANVAEHHDCEGHFEVDDTGYAHSYPRLVSGRPTEDEVKDWNPLEQNN